MQTNTPVWSGWNGILQSSGTRYQFTWDEWCASQRKHIRQPVPETASIIVRGLVAQSFLHWLDGDIVTHDGWQASDREQAQQTFLHILDEAVVLQSASSR